jgi:hypothetical protein
MEATNGMEMKHYILKGHEIIETDWLTWARWVEQIDERRVARTERGKIVVSTVFLGLDHNWVSEGPPVLFETMIFGSQRLSEYQRRYCTWDEANTGHERAVKMVHFTDVIWETFPALPTPDWSWKHTIKYLIRGTLATN